MNRKLLLLTIVLAGLALLTGVAAAAPATLRAPGAPEATGNFLVSDAAYVFDVDVAAAPDGRFVAVWEAQESPEGGLWTVFARRFDAAGAPLGPVFSVPEANPLEERSPAVGVDDAGNFIIVYARPEEFKADRGIRARRYNAAGVPQGGEIWIDDHTMARYGQPAIAVGPAGDFIVTWEAVAYGEVRNHIQMRRFNAAGQPLDAVQFANTRMDLTQTDPDVARDAAGRVTVAWSSYYGDQDGDGGAVIMRRFAAGGAPLTGELIVNATTAGHQDAPRLAVAPSGDLLIVWRGDAPTDSTRLTGMARAYNATTGVFGTEFNVSGLAPHYSGFRMDVARLADGRFLAVWGQGTNLVERRGLLGRYLTVDGPVGGAFPLTACFASSYNAPGVAAAAGSWVAVWNGHSDGVCLPGAPEGGFVMGQMGAPGVPGPLYVSVTANGVIAGQTVTRGDIISYDPVYDRWQLVFDASDLNLRGNLTAFDFLDDGSLLLVYDAVARRVPDIGEARPQQIIRFEPVRGGGLGGYTEGTLTVYLDGRQVGLTTAAERIDALEALPNGDLLISTYGGVAVPGVSGLDEDILRFHPTRLGDFPLGTWTMEFDGSAAGVLADLNSLAVGPGGGRFLTYQTTVNVAGGRVPPGTILRCAPQGAGCVWSIYRDLRADGLPAKMVVDALEVLWP